MPTRRVHISDADEIKTSSPIGAWNCNSQEIVTDRRIDREASQLTDMRVHRDVTLPLNLLTIFFR